MKTLFLKSNILHIRTNEGEFEVSDPETAGIMQNGKFFLWHTDSNGGYKHTESEGVDCEWPYGVELIYQIRASLGYEDCSEELYNTFPDVSRRIVAQLLPEEKKAESAYKEFETGEVCPQCGCIAHPVNKGPYNHWHCYNRQCPNCDPVESSEPQEKEHLLKDWKWPAIEIERELHKYLGKVTSVDGKSEFHLGFRLCRDWIQKHYFLIYKANKLPIDSDESEVFKPVSAPSESQEEMWAEVISECRIYDGTPTYFLMIQKRLSERFKITRKPE